MSTLEIRRFLQKVVGGTTQPLKLGGILEDGSDAKLTVATDGSISTSTAVAVPSLVVGGQSQLGYFVESNAGAHNSIYRGKYLGASVTVAQYAEISAGTFADLYIGDYWTIGSVNYRIAAFNYFLRCGDTDFNTNHITLVPDAPLYNAVMNPTNVTTGAYIGSQMRTANLASAISTIGTAFSGHVKTHRQLLANATASGKASGSAWYDASIELMNEVMAYGCSAWGESTMNNGFQTGISKSQLPLFAHRPDMISNRNTFWLRDVADSVAFARVIYAGFADYYSASSSYGVRPAFSIG